MNRKTDGHFLVFLLVPACVLKCAIMLEPYQVLSRSRQKESSLSSFPQDTMRRERKTKIEEQKKGQETKKKQKKNGTVKSKKRNRLDLNQVFI